MIAKNSISYLQKVNNKIFHACTILQIRHLFKYSNNPVWQKRSVFILEMEAQKKGNVDVNYLTWRCF